MRYSHPVTPVELNPALVGICEQLAPGTMPIFVDVLPDTGTPTNECFHLVEERVRREGGSRLIGWALWEMPGLYAEAEYHAIWQTPDGTYLDISPKLESTAKVLFLPTPGAEYNGLQKDNVRRAISKDPDVQLLLQCFERRFEIMNRGDRAGQYGEISLEGAEAAELHRVVAEAEATRQRIEHLYPSFDAYLPCPCGSGKKTKWCHKSYLK